MARKNVSLPWLRYFTGTVVVGLSAFGVYYYLHVEEALRRQSEFYMNQLALSARLVEESFTNLEERIANQIDDYERTSAESNEGQPPERSPDADDEKENPKRRLLERLNAIVGVTVETRETSDDTTKVPLHTILDASGVAFEYEDIHLRVELERVLELPTDVFDAAFLSSPDGPVIHSVVTTEAHRVTNLKALAEGTVEGAWEENPGIYDVRVGNDRHSLYLRPVALDVNGGPMRLGGLVSRDEARRRAMEISPSLVMWLVGLLFLGILALPTLRMINMGPREPLKGHDLLTVVFALVAGSALLTYIALGAVRHGELQDGLQREIESVGVKIENSLIEEVLTVGHDLRRVDTAFEEFERVWGPDLRYAPWLNDDTSILTYYEDFVASAALPEIKKVLGADFEPGAPGLFQVIWLDAKGNQVCKWRPDGKKPTAYIAVRDRPYFLEVIEGRAWDLTSVADSGGRLASPSLFVESIRSKNSGELYAAVSMRRTSDVVPVVMTVVTLQSVLHPVTPERTRFAVVDSQGEVLFHSDPSRNLRENFAGLCANPKKLQGLLATRTHDVLDVNYATNDIRASVNPIHGTPWMLITYAELKPVRDRFVETLTFTLTLFIGYLLLALVFSVWLHSSGRRKGKAGEARHMWFWARRAHHARYLVLIGALVLVGIYWSVLFQSPRTPRVLGLALSCSLLTNSLVHLLVRDWTIVNLVRWKGGAVLVGAALLAVGIGIREPALIVASVAMILAFRVRLGGFLMCAVSMVALAAIDDSTGADPWLLVVTATFVGLVAAIVGFNCFRPQWYGRWHERIQARWQQHWRNTYVFCAVLLLMIQGVAPTTLFFLVLEQEQTELASKRSQMTALQAVLDHHGDLGRGPSTVGSELKERTGSAAWGIHLPMIQWTDPITSGSASRQPVVRALRHFVPLREGGKYSRWLTQEKADDDRLEWRIASVADSSGDSLRVRSAQYLSSPAYLESAGLYSPLSLFDPFRPLLLVGFAVFLVAALGSVVTIVLRKALLLHLIYPRSLRVDIPHDDAQKREESPRFLEVGPSPLAQGSDSDGTPRAEPYPWSTEPMVWEDFDEGLENPVSLQAKRQELESLLEDTGTAVILESRIDPIYYLGEKIAELEQSREKPAPKKGESAPAESSELDDARQLLRLLHGFERRIRPLAPRASERQLRHYSEKLGALAPGIELEIVDAIAQECWPRASMQHFGELTVREPGLKALDREQVVDLMGDHFAADYEMLWNLSTVDEKIVLHDLCTHGLVNWRMEFALKSLLRRRLVVSDGSFRVMNESFRRYVLRRADGQEIHQWRQEATPSAWRRIRLLVVLAIIGVLGFLMATQQDVFKEIIAVAGALAVSIPALVRVVGVMASGREGAAK